MTYEELVEKLARIIDRPAFEAYEMFYRDCTRIPEAEAKRQADGMYGWQMHEARKTAATLLATILEALSEPTPEMMGALWSMRMSNSKESFAECLHAMLAASPLVEEERR